MSGRAELRALRDLDAIYRKADALHQGWSCARSGGCCELAKAGREPYLWPVELLRVRAAIERSGRSLPMIRADGACPLLDESGRCSIYADRPLGCRTFYCERGSGPRRVAREEVTELMVRVQRIAEAYAESLDGDRPEPVPLVKLLSR